MINTILCGGSGTRLWPISREFFPKQFCKFIQGRSLFQENLLRNAPLCDDHLIITNRAHHFLAKDQLEELSLSGKFLLEPLGRNTAPAVALACLGLPPTEVLLVTPSDHLVSPINLYESAIQEAEEMAKEGYLVLFGLKPSYPEIGFGYIKAQGHLVESFVEKPHQKRAEEFCRQGNYYWNSGMACFQAGVFLEELQKYAPEIFQACQRVEANLRKKGTLQKEDMMSIPANSMDYAVMEFSQKVRMVAFPGGIQWSDLGKFESLSHIFPEDQQGNTLEGEVCFVESKNNFVFSPDQFSALIEVEDLVVIHTKDALLISKKGASSRVQSVVESLKNRGSELIKAHPEEPRPWGTFVVLEEGPRWKVKRIEVKPGKRLSLQKHRHRSERWTVIQGRAKVSIDGVEEFLEGGQTVFIPLGAIHRLSNVGEDMLVLIEVQMGDYFGEDDLLRLADDFHRD